MRHRLQNFLGCAMFNRWYADSKFFNRFGCNVLQKAAGHCVGDHKNRTNQTKL